MKKNFERKKCKFEDTKMDFKTSVLMNTLLETDLFRYKMHVMVDYLCVTDSKSILLLVRKMAST